MTKTAFMALLLALLLPFVGYFLVKHFSKDAVHMPRRYYMDSVITKNDNGKISTDTIWHKTKNVQFVNQFGNKVSLDSLKGKIVVLNTIFTRCAGICPRITKLMKKLQNSFVNLDSAGHQGKASPQKFIGSDSIIQFLSVSIDPNYDSAHHLRKFGDRVDANYDNWWFVTGNRDSIYDFLLKEIKANVADSVNVKPDFVHTDMFFLLDRDLVFRGAYHSLNITDTSMSDDTVSLAKLAADIPALMLEKNRKKPSVLRGYIPILPLILGGIACVIFVMSIMNKKRTY